MILSAAAREIRRLILEESKRANVGHIGSALSIADILCVLYSGVLRIAKPDDDDRDRFILSKGHASLALYSALYLQGWLTRDQLQTYCADDTLLGVHPERDLVGIDFSTGSLGHGLSIGAGAALAARFQRSDRRVFVLVSDAECNEGSLWEAVMFAAHWKLANLVAIVDLNGQQALGYTQNVLSLGDMVARWRAFGWNAHEVSGHNRPALLKLLAGLDAKHSAPHVVIARTTFGRGVSFMESKIKWHYLPMNDAEYAEALAEVERGA